LTVDLLPKHTHTCHPKQGSQTHRPPTPDQNSPPSNSKSKSRSKPLPLVERTNSLPLDQFIEKYVPQSSLEFKIPSPPSQQQQQSKPNDDTSTRNDEDRQEQVDYYYTLDIHTAQSLPETDFQACFDLIELTSKDDYANSSIGWSPTKKRKEMKLPDMRYILLRPAQRQGAVDNNSKNNDNDNNEDSGKVTEGEGTDPEGEKQQQQQKLLGFLSFMVTYEDGKEVIYCYEIHLSPTLRGKGAGKHLMLLFEEIGRRVGLEKAMLTVFKSNTVARQFYERLGYDVDEYSPQPRRLRNGTVKEPDYLILSKGLKGGEPNASKQDSAHNE